MSGVIVTADSVLSLPDGLPVPQDDGAADHLPGICLPVMALDSTGGGHVDLSALPGWVVVFCYPMTGRPGVALPEGWDAIPGARGCTPQSCAFRDHHAEFRAQGAQVFGLSTQSAAEQQEAGARLDLSFALLSDGNLEFARALCLPTFEAGGRTRIKRLTLIIRDGRVEKVFYPVFPPDRNAGDVLAWFHENS